MWIYLTAANCVLTSRLNELRQADIQKQNPVQQLPGLGLDHPHLLAQLSLRSRLRLKQLLDHQAPCDVGSLKPTFRRRILGHIAELLGPALFEIAAVRASRWSLRSAVSWPVSLPYGAGREIISVQRAIPGNDP
jgi:hypothetical protein